MNKKQDRILTIVLWVLLAVSVAPLLWYGTRALITDRFLIKGCQWSRRCIQVRRCG